MNRVENVNLWRNVGSGNAGEPAAMGNWIAVRLEQPEINRNAIGAWIEVKTGDLVTSHEITIGGGHGSGQVGWQHFGIGPSESTEVRIQWPDGAVGSWINVDANRFVIIGRNSTEATEWAPAEG